MRIVLLVLLVSSVSLDKQLSAAFYSSPWCLSRLRSNGFYSSIELAVASKPPRSNSKKEEKKQTSGWENFKRTVYNGVDSVGDITTKISGGKENSQKGAVSDGYSSFEQSIKKGSAPGSKLMAEYQARASALGVDRTMSSKTVSKTNTQTSFDAFKENLYSASDAFGSLATESKKQTPLDKLRSIPYKESLAQELGVASEKVEDLLSDNPVTRFQAQQEIREREARQRAEARNERIRAKKEDLYKIVDAMQAAVDAFPDKIEETENSIKKTIESVRGVPATVEKVVEGVKSIPSSVKMKASQTKQSVKGTFETTKKVAKDVLDMPNKVAERAKGTQRAVLDTKEYIGDGVTNMKVFLRLEKPKPKPPKLPPPKSMTAKDVALKVAGSAASGAGKITWWATKNVATAAWNGAQSVIEERQKLPTSPPKLPKPPSSPPPNKTDKQMTELQKEVDAALRLAEETLRNSDE